MDEVFYLMLRNMVSGLAAKLDAVKKALVYRGAVDYISDLPLDAETGDVYSVRYKGTEGTVSDGSEHVWTGEDWINLGPDSTDEYVAIDQGVSQAGKFMVVGTDGRVQAQEIPMWTGGEF